MKRRCFLMFLLVALIAGLVSCSPPYGYRFYPDVPRFAPTHPAHVELLRREPKRSHLRLGEVWIRPEPNMGRGYVEGVLREQAARMGADALVIMVDRFFHEPVYEWGHSPGAYRERQIIGIGIRYKRR
jgi:hypothetical protein